MKKTLYLLLIVFAFSACDDNDTEKDYKPSRNKEFNNKIKGHWRQFDTSLDFENTFILNNDFTFTHYDVNLNTNEKTFYYENKDYKLNKQGLFFNESPQASYYYRLVHPDTLYIKLDTPTFGQYDKCYRVKE